MTFYKFYFFLIIQFFVFTFPGQPLFAFEQNSKKISLLQCLKYSLENNYKVLTSKEEIKYSKGVLLGTEAAFDSAVSLGADYKKNKSPLNKENESILGKDSMETTETSYSLGYSKELESGIIINPYLSTTSSETDTSASAPETRTGAYLSFAIPLMKGLGKPNTALRDAAFHDIENSKLALKQSITDSFHETTLAYWYYVMNFQNYQHYKLREKRAYNLYLQTKALIEADELPAAELNEAEANLWAKKTSLISAEESLTKSLKDLYSSMGKAANNFSDFLIPENRFEEFKVDNHEIMGLKASPLIELGSKNRFDIKESHGREKTIKSRKNYYKNRLLPDVNLGFQFGYESLKEGNSLNALANSPYSNPAGPSFKISLSCDLPVQNKAAKSDLILQETLLDKQKINSRELLKRMKNEILNSVSVLKKNINELKNAEKTIILYKKAFQNQEVKFKMGMGTQLDLINSQDKINNADLNLISARYKFAVSVAKLRYETATIVSFINDRADITIKNLTSIPITGR